MAYNPWTRSVSAAHKHARQQHGARPHSRRQTGDVGGELCDDRNFDGLDHPVGDLAHGVGLRATAMVRASRGTTKNREDEDISRGHSVEKRCAVGVSRRESTHTFPPRPFPKRPPSSGEHIGRCCPITTSHYTSRSDTTSKTPAVRAHAKQANVKMDLVVPPSSPQHMWDLECAAGPLKVCGACSCLAPSLSVPFVCTSKTFPLDQVGGEGEGGGKQTLWPASMPVPLRPVCGQDRLSSSISEPAASMRLARRWGKVTEREGRRRDTNS